MRAVRTFGPPTHTHFLADANGESMIEIYNNSKAAVPDYRKIDPLILHLAFAADDVRATRTRLLQAGATAEGDVTVADNGDELAMLRDPWGFAIQLVKRRRRCCRGLGPFNSTTCCGRSAVVFSPG